MKQIIRNLAFDQIYHEHLLYYNLATLDRLLWRHGVELFDAYLAPIHGGQMIGFAAHQGRRQASARLLELRAAEERDRANEFATYISFAGRIEGFKADNLGFLHDARRRGKRIWGFGAPVKGNTLLNYFGIGPALIEYLVERNPLRRGLFAPGSHIPVLIEDELPGLPDIYYVLAWNFKKEILERNQSSVQKGVLFHFPVNPPE